MAQARSASALLRRCSFLADFSASRIPANRGRGLASLSVSLSERTTGNSGSGAEDPGWRVRAGVVGGGVAAVAGFMSLLQQPVVSRSEGVQQSAEALVATETLDARLEKLEISVCFFFESIGRVYLISVVTMTFFSFEYFQFEIEVVWCNSSSFLRLQDKTESFLSN